MNQGLGGNRPEPGALRRSRPEQEPSVGALGGRAISCHGHLLDGDSAIAPLPQVALFGSAAAQTQLKPIDRSLHTGTTAIDALTPIGRGQSMMLFGEGGTGKSSIARDAALAQSLNGSADDVHCVLALSDGGAERAKHELHELRGALHRRCTIVAPMHDSTAERFLCLAAAA